MNVAAIDFPFVSHEITIWDVELTTEAYWATTAKYVSSLVMIYLLYVSLTSLLPYLMQTGHQL